MRIYSSENFGGTHERPPAADRVLFPKNVQVTRPAGDERNESVEKKLLAVLPVKFAGVFHGNRQLLTPQNVKSVFDNPSANVLQSNANAI